MRVRKLVALLALGGCVQVQPVAYVPAPYPGATGAESGALAGALVGAAIGAALAAEDEQRERAAGMKRPVPAW